MPLFALLLTISASIGQAAPAPDLVSALYMPVEGGWRVHVDAATPPEIRLHRRPLFPPADKGLVWTEAEQAKLLRCGFRPLVVAYLEPRFLFDFHSAGGLLGHLYVGLVQGEQGKWLHQWETLDVSYVEGRMEYVATDPDFPGTTVRIAATPLASSAGLILKVQIEGTPEGTRLIWAYGGASAFFTNYAMTAPEFAFAPEQCRKDRVQWGGNAFVLRRTFDESDVIMKEVFGAGRYLPGWEARVEGGSSWAGKAGYGAPDSFVASPQALCGNTRWLDAAGLEVQPGCVAVQEITLTATSDEGYIAVGMGGNIAEAIRQPLVAYEAALARNASIAGRVVVRTPDPYLNAAVPMMAFATEGTWGDSAILHGGWSWRFAYLGWRGWYGSTCYGWTDRVKKSIQNHTTLGLIKQGDDAGALGALLEYEPGVFYNMNEVFLDQTRQYFDYTGDLELMREIFPVLKGIVAWENRRLQPGEAGLYENSLNTWISDSHWYIGGQCTQASAYMLGEYSFLARLAEKLGEDPAPFRAQAERIREAMQRALWMPDKGVFAEYLDTRGEKLLHPEPELPTLYHAAEFGAATPGQIRQMLDWADANLRQESTPGGGKLFWSSNWYPNRGRSYTHSTYEMAYGENLNFALTHYLAGRGEQAYRILRATLCGIFNGPTPGGLSCHSLVDGKQRANDEFSDASSMWGRAVMEGLFGIVPDRPNGVVRVTPQFPEDWPEASIKTPHFSYHWERRNGQTSLRWESPVETSIEFRVPTRDMQVETCLVNGNETKEFQQSDSDGTEWFSLATAPAREGRITVQFIGEPTPPPQPARSVAPPKTSPPVWLPPGAGEKDLNLWTLVDMGKVYNAALTEVLARVVREAQPPAPPASTVGFGYWKDHLLTYHGSRNEAISDAAWRAKVGEDGVAWTADGIPFHSAKEGANIAVVTRAGGFPEALEIPVNASGKTLYLMISGMTWPAQSHVPNLRVTLDYVDGTSVSRDLVSPFDIGDCWSTWCGRFHDTPANGFENLGGRTGPAGSIEVSDLTQPVAVDTEAHLVAFPLKPETALASVKVQAIANEVIFGVMGASVLIQN
jgi:hypothetical protein